MSKKFDFPELTSITEQFIEQHSEHLIFQSIQFNTQLQTITQNEEDFIASHLEQYIKDERMLSLSIPILYRILQNYFNKSSNTNTEIIEFLFACLDKYGEDASILFNNVDFKEASIEIASRLIKQYSNKFNFSMISSTLLEATKELIKEKEKSFILINEMKTQLDQN